MSRNNKEKQDYDKAHRKLEIALKRAPKAEEISHELQIDVSELMLRRKILQLAVTRVLKSN